MATTRGNIAQFTAVDRSPDSGWFIDFMDAANAVPGYERVRALLAAALLPLEGQTVLDVGCGTGDDARELATAVGATGHVVGLDVSAAMIDEARRRNAGSGSPSRFEVGDVSHLDFPDGSFDCVRAKLVLMHCEDIEGAAAELVRVVSPGGRVAVFDYDFDTSTIDHSDQRSTREIVRCLSDGHPNRWSGRQLWRRFIDLGLREVAVTPYTIILPFDFFRISVSGKLASAQGEGALSLTRSQLDDWWVTLEDAARDNRFFASLTGFLLSGTR